MSEKITGELLVRFNARGGVDGIFAMADNQATGAIQAVESAGLKIGVANKGIVVVASNCMKDGIIHIKSGQQYGTATQIPTEEAEIAAKKIAGAFQRREAEEVRDGAGRTASPRRTSTSSPPAARTERASTMPVDHPFSPSKG